MLKLYWELNVVFYKHNDNEFGKNFDVKNWHPTGLSLRVSAKG